MAQHLEITGWSSRIHQFDSQHRHSTSQMSVTPGRKFYIFWPLKVQDRQLLKDIHKSKALTYIKLNEKFIKEYKEKTS